MSRFFISFVLFLTFVVVGNAQAVRRFHQNLSLSEATSLQIDAQGEVEVVKWAGSDILVEVTVSSENGSVAILNHLQTQGRFDLLLNVEGSSAKLVNKLTNRQAIKVKGVEMDEHVKYTISIPENFDGRGLMEDHAYSKARK